MTTFDEREAAFENRSVHGQERAGAGRHAGHRRRAAEPAPAAARPKTA